MDFSPQEAVDQAFLVMYAEDMYRNNQSEPHNDARIAKDGWKVVAYIRSRNVTFIKRELELDEKKPEVFYGYLAQRIDDPTKWQVAIRGTDGFVEWVLDAEAPPDPHPTLADATIARGFWSIYERMGLYDLGGQLIDKNAAAGVVKTVGGGAVTIVGHSLGSALATYLSYDVAAARPGKTTRAFLFASPQPGNGAYGARYAKTAPEHHVINYVLDVVPRVPFGPRYDSLPGPHVLQPSTADAGVRVGLGHNHHVICYAAMIDYARTKAKYDAGLPLSSDRRSNEDLWASVVGPKGSAPGLALGLAAALNHLDQRLTGRFDGFLDWALRRADIVRGVFEKAIRAYARALKSFDETGDAGPLERIADRLKSLNPADPKAADALNGDER